MTKIWPNFNPDTTAPATYVALLFDVEYPAADKALMIIGRRSKFAPSPAEIIEAISELTGTQRMSASEAWSIAMPLCSRYVTKEQLEAVNPEIRKALNLAGHASYLGTMSSDDARRAFMGAWKALGDTEHREHVQRIGSGLTQIKG